MDTRRSSLVGFDADSAAEAALDAGGDDVHLVVEYTADDFNILYADELTRSLYGSDSEMTDHFSEVHSYVNIDFAELDLFEDLMRAGGEVRAITTHMDHISVVRVYARDQEGLFLSISPDAPVTPVVEAVEDAL